MNTLITAPQPHEKQTFPAVEPLLKLDEVAKIIRRSHWTLRKYVADGMIQAVSFGRDILIEPAEVRRFIEEAKK